MFSQVSLAFVCKVDYVDNNGHNTSQRKQNDRSKFCLVHVRSRIGWMQVVCVSIVSQQLHNIKLRTLYLDSFSIKQSETVLSCKCLY